MPTRLADRQKITLGGNTVGLICRRADAAYYAAYQAGQHNRHLADTTGDPRARFRLGNLGIAAARAALGIPVENMAIINPRTGGVRHFELPNGKSVAVRTTSKPHADYTIPADKAWRYQQVDVLVLLWYLGANAKTGAFQGPEQFAVVGWVPRMAALANSKAAAARPVHGREIECITVRRGIFLPLDTLLGTMYTGRLNRNCNLALTSAHTCVTLGLDLGGA